MTHLRLLRGGADLAAMTGKRNAAVFDGCQPAMPHDEQICEWFAAKCDKLIYVSVTQGNAGL
jgi:hypothetical protein